jgi:DNA-binding PadR family transcriptional regulator
MENVVLGLLVIHSLTIYELNRAFKQGISMFYSASYGSLQIAVKNLLKKELIVFAEKVDRGRNKKVYSITPLGQQAFYNWMLDEIPLNKLEVTALSKVYFLGLIESVPQRRQILLEILARIEQVQGSLEQMNSQLAQVDVPPAYRDIFKYQRKTLDYGLQAHAFGKQWFQALLDELETAHQATAAPGS